ARAAGALLLPRLAAAARDVRAILGLVRAAARRGVRVHDRLPDEGVVHAAAEHFVVQLERSDFLVVRVDDVYFHSSQLSALSKFLLPATAYHLPAIFCPWASQ